MIARIYLTLIATLYILLSAWCSVDPVTTSQKVGLERINDSGRSEFLVIYGGLELGMALVFLMPWFNRDFTAASLWACILLHSGLVVFRTVSYFLYADISAFTTRLAIGEWVILLSGLACWWLSRDSS